MAQSIKKMLTLPDPLGDGDSGVISIAEFSQTTFIVKGTNCQFQVWIDSDSDDWAPFMEPADVPYAVVLEGPAARAKVVISGWVAGPGGSTLTSIVALGTRSMEGSGQAR